MTVANVLLVSSDLDERALVSALLGQASARVIEVAFDEGLDAIVERERIQLAVVIEHMREDPVLDWTLSALARHPRCT